MTVKKKKKRDKKKSKNVLLGWAASDLSAHPADTGKSTRSTSACFRLAWAEGAEPRSSVSSSDPSKEPSEVCWKCYLYWSEPSAEGIPLASSDVAPGDARDACSEVFMMGHWWGRLISMEGWESWTSFSQSWGKPARSFTVRTGQFKKSRARVRRIKKNQNEIFSSWRYYINFLALFSPMEAVVTRVCNISGTSMLAVYVMCVCGDDKN